MKNQTYKKENNKVTFIIYNNIYVVRKIMEENIFPLHLRIKITVKRN